VTEQESWNGNFYPISLHGALKYLLSNSKNIKKSLHCMTKYIKNKSIKRNKTNDVPNLNSIGEAAWNFISALYKSE